VTIIFLRHAQRRRALCVAKTKETAMIEIFRDGGWGMWAILFVGLILIVDAARFAHRPDPKRLGFLGMLALSTVSASVCTTLIDVGKVFSVLAREDKVPDGQIVRILFAGMKECMSPGMFGAVILTITALLVAVGMLRRARAADA
jgi:hypothetical protein